MSNKREGTIEERIRSIICEELGVDESEVTLNASLSLDLGADSLDVMEITFAVEEEFEIEIADEDVEDLTTVGKVVELATTLVDRKKN